MRSHMSKAKNNVNDLLAAIKRQPATPTPEETEAEMTWLRSMLTE